LGGMAGLAMLNGLQMQEGQGGHMGLFSFPTFSFNALRAQTQNPLLLTWALTKMLLLFAAVVFVISPTVFYRDNGKQQSGDGPEQTPNSSALDIRRSAWLTSTQQVWVPDSEVIDMLAVGIKALKLICRQILGWRVYSFVFRVTEEEEATRVKAWLIAIDAQL